MTKDVITVKPNASVTEAAKIMHSKGISSLVVVEDNRVVGIITHEDLVGKIVMESRDPKSVTVGEVMSGDIITANSDTSIDDLVKLMLKHKIKRIPIVDNTLVGIISVTALAIASPVLAKTSSPLATIGMLKAWIHAERFEKKVGDIEDKQKVVEALPKEIVDLVSKSRIGHISIHSPTGQSLVYPVAYLFNGRGIYFMASKDSNIYKYLKVDPAISFAVDNDKLLDEAQGILVQGKAILVESKKSLVSLISTTSTLFKYFGKYPDVAKFYVTHMDELPSKRSLYKYRPIEIDPRKIFYWIGYEFGHVHIPKKAARR
jgi:predicted transcriptional regulator